MLAVVAARTTRITIGTVITPVPRRRPWQLARQTTTLDRLSDGRVVLGVGIGSPAYGDFGIFHEPSGDRERAELLDEGLDVLAGLWSGEPFSYAGAHLNVDTVRFTPTPRAAAANPGLGRRRAARAAADRARRQVGRIRPDQVVELRRPGPTVGGRLRRGDCPDHRTRGRRRDGPRAGYDMVVWAEVAPEPAALADWPGPTRTPGRPGGSRRRGRAGLVGRYQGQGQGRAARRRQRLACAERFYGRAR